MARILSKPSLFGFSPADKSQRPGRLGGTGRVRSPIARGTSIAMCPQSIKRPVRAAPGTGQLEREAMHAPRPTESFRHSILRRALRDRILVMDGAMGTM